MHRVIHQPDKQRVPIWAWSSALSEETVAQLKNLARQPYVLDHVAAMPDAHLASGVAVGTVFATERTVVPGAIGGDIGCGMAAIRFGLEAASLDRRSLERILGQLALVIPVGDAVHRGGDRRPLPEALAVGLSTHALSRELERNGPRQLGTLGGGNHFLELDRDAAGWLWLMVHSGSRGVGGAIGAHHRAAAGGALGGLSLDAPSGQSYLQDAELAMRFAQQNREQMLERAIEVIGAATGAAPDPESRVEVAHNFVALEEHGARQVVVHRKGATAAREGQLGLVPGSMGTASYLVRGRGSAASFGSCSHGAGRVMSRKEARASIRPEALIASMRRVVFDRERARDLVEEAPAAYRDIREVIEDQAELVEPVLRLEPIAVLKG